MQYFYIKILIQIQFFILKNDYYTSLARVRSEIEGTHIYYVETIYKDSGVADTIWIKEYKE